MNIIKDNDTISDDEVVASDVPPRYLLGLYIMIILVRQFVCSSRIFFFKQ